MNNSSIHEFFASPLAAGSRESSVHGDFVRLRHPAHRASLSVRYVHTAHGAEAVNMRQSKGVGIPGKLYSREYETYVVNVSHLAADAIIGAPTIVGIIHPWCEEARSERRRGP